MHRLVLGGGAGGFSRHKYFPKSLQNGIRQPDDRRMEYILSDSSVRQSRLLGRIEESRHWSSGTLDRLNIHTVFSVWLSVVDKFVRVHLSQLPLPADG